MTRREVILGGAALLGGVVLGKPTRGAVGAAGASQKSAASWVNPYITDELVAQWDGEWNIGGGLHDSNTTVWKDISGHGRDLTSSSFRWIDNALDDSASNIRLDLGDLSGEFPSAITLEAVVRCPNFRNNGFIFDFYNHSSAGISLYTTNMASPYGIRAQLRNSTGNNNTGVATVNAQYQTAVTLVWEAIGGRLYGFGSLTFPSSSLAFTVPPVYYLLGASNGSYNNFRGFVYSLRVYNRGLTDQEILANYMVDKQRFGL